MLEHAAARPCTCVRRRPRHVKTAVLAGSNPARICDLSQGLVVKNTAAFLLGFAATLTPLLIYVAWVTWRIAEAI
jgi:hypothetical protein